MPKRFIRVPAEYFQPEKIARWTQTLTSSDFTILLLALGPELHALTCRALDRRVRW